MYDWLKYKLISLGILVLITLAVLAFILFFFSGEYKFSKDNIIEESLEQVIQDQTGLEIDFTPEN
jgi:hypothetical protein